MTKFIKNMFKLSTIACLIASAQGASALPAQPAADGIQIVGVSGQCSGGNSVYTSPNGTDWTYRFAGTLAGMFAVAANSAGLFAVGRSGRNLHLARWNNLDQGVHSSDCFKSVECHHCEQ